MERLVFGMKEGADMCHAENWEPLAVETLAATSSTAPSHPASQSPAEMLSSFSYLEQDSISYLSVDDTEYSTDEMSDRLCSVDPLYAAPTRGFADLVKPILSPIKQDLVDRVKFFLESLL
jgi:hypothetical protein